MLVMALPLSFFQACLAAPSKVDNLCVTPSFQLSLLPLWCYRLFFRMWQHVETEDSVFVMHRRLRHVTLHCGPFSTTFPLCGSSWQHLTTCFSEYVHWSMCMLHQTGSSQYICIYAFTSTPFHPLLPSSVSNTSGVYDNWDFVHGQLLNHQPGQMVVQLPQSRCNLRDCILYHDQVFCNWGCFTGSANQCILGNVYLRFISPKVQLLPEFFEAVWHMWRRRGRWGGGGKRRQA